MSFGVFFHSEMAGDRGRVVLSKSPNFNPRSSIGQLMAFHGAYCRAFLLT